MHSSPSEGMQTTFAPVPYVAPAMEQLSAPPTAVAGGARRRSSTPRRARRRPQPVGASPFAAATATAAAAEAGVSHAALATETRRSVLDAYAAKVAARDAALDARAGALRVAEERAAAAVARARDRQDAVDELERTLRIEMAEGLERVAGRERRLAEMDLEKAQALLECRRTADQEARRASLKEETVQELEETQSFLEKLKDDLRSVSAALDAARARKKVIDAEVVTRKAEMDQLADTYLQREQRLQALESQISARNSTLRDREKENSELAHSLTAEMDLMRREKAAMDQRLASIAQRERDIAAREDELRRREASARDGVARANQLSRDAYERLEALEQERLALARASSEIEARENAIRTRELSAQEKEANLSLKDQEIRRIHSALETRENSISRAGAAVTAREKAVDHKAQLLDNREDALDRREREVMAFEMAARSRETELDAREAGLARMEAEAARRQTRVRTENGPGRADLSHSLGSRTSLLAADDGRTVKEQVNLQDSQAQPAVGRPVKAERITEETRDAVFEGSEESGNLNLQTGPNIEVEASQALAAWINAREHIKDLTRNALRAAQELAPFCVKRRAEGLLHRIQSELTSLLNAVEYSGNSGGMTVFDALENEMQRHDEWHKTRKAQLKALAEIGIGLLAARQWDEQDNANDGKTVNGIVSSLFATDNWIGDRGLPTIKRHADSGQESVGPEQTGAERSQTEASAQSSDSIFNRQEFSLARNSVVAGGSSESLLERVALSKAEITRTARVGEHQHSQENLTGTQFEPIDHTAEHSVAAGGREESIEMAKTKEFLQFRRALQSTGLDFDRGGSVDSELMHQRVEEALRDIDEEKSSGSSRQ